MGFHVPSLTFRPAPIEGTDIDGTRWVRCENWSRQCNWLVEADSGSSQCFSCRLTRRRPDDTDTVALAKLEETAVAKRRLLIQLFELGLPVTPYYEKEGGLAFELISSVTTGERVITGHANGVITIDLAESLDAHREALRVKLGEPYRTMLGHFRHEIAHYYQTILAGDEPLLSECRALFGDERASYSDAMQRHYSQGAPGNWSESFISEYATMHPWEDFAETFAHYLHITGTLSTTALAGVVMLAERALFEGDDVVPAFDYSDLSIERMLHDWHWLSLMFNRVNRTMGHRDMYPFEIPKPVVTKLGFMHRIITERGREARLERARAAARV